MSHRPLSETVVDAANSAAVDLLAELHGRAFSAQNERPWTAKSIEELLKSPGFEGYLYYVGEQAVGFSLVRCVCDEAELISIAVDPIAQGDGFGRVALRQLMSQVKANGVSTLFLEVREDNLKARQLYQSMGFKNIGCRPAYYQTLSGKKYDALVFSLDLGQ